MTQSGHWRRNFPIPHDLQPSFVGLACGRRRPKVGDEGFTTSMAPCRKDREAEDVQMASGEGRTKSSVARASQ